MKRISCLFVLVFSITLFSCSSDSGDDSLNEEGVDLMIGEWLAITENDYFCGTHDVAVERPTDQNQTRVYNPDGTWQGFQDGNPDTTGTWENLGNGNYRLYYDDDKVEQTEEIEFLHNGNTMRFGVDDPCVDFIVENTYSYTVWVRLVRY